MAIQTDLSVSPYFDDYQENKDFYKILFQPGVSVQVRELNQLQSILQKQIERFGDNIFRQGTIISGCNITLHNNIQYVKIKDLETDSTPVDVTKYSDYRIKNQLEKPLEATIITSEAGFESRDPDLNTLYVRYINHGFGTGDAVGVAVFSPNEMLTVYDPDFPIEKVSIIDQSSGFIRTDKVVFTSAIAIQNTTGGTSFANNFFVNDIITNDSANLQIIATPDTTTRSDAVILKVKPIADDLKNRDQSVWTVYKNDNIRSLDSSPSDVAVIVDVIGSGAEAVVSTTSLGAVEEIVITNKGSGYYILPEVSISSQSASLGQISQFDSTPQNYLTNITVANALTSPIGNAYAVSVGEGVIYQKGYFSRVDEQLTVVEKYNNQPDLKVVGFQTEESVVTSAEDDSLFDNATGAPNVTAPGANRLRLTPKLTSLTKSEADLREDFLYIVEFSDGNPYKQNRQTEYNIIGDYISDRIYQESGNYVLDEFLLSTKSPTAFVNEATKFDVVVDPGSAYINGKKVETVEYSKVSVDKAIDTFTAEDAKISMNFGNYVLVNNLGGLFNFKIGDTISLHPTAGAYMTSRAGITPSLSGLGTSIGTARIRSLVLDEGIAGTNEAVYKLYLFDIIMNSGKNFADTRSVFYDGSGTLNGVADTVLDGGKAVLRDTNLSTLVYYAGFPAIANVSNVSYVYRTHSEAATWNSDGTISINLPSVGPETFPYTGTLSSGQEKDIIVIPLANSVSSTTMSGSINSTSSSTTVLGNSTAFVGQFRPGDFIRVGGNVVGQVKTIANNTLLSLFQNSATTGTLQAYEKFNPAYVPISLEPSNRTVEIDPTGKTMTISLGAINSALNESVYVAYNVRSGISAPVAKTVNRDRYVRLRLSDAVGSNTGPWSVGVSDVFRLDSVRLGANASFTDTQGTDVTQYFYIDHNQTEDFYDISYLYLKPNAPLSINAVSDFLLVKFDYFTHAADGLKVPGGSGTYNINDALSLANSPTSINTLEIPEVYGPTGNYYDLRDNFDLRPVVSATATPAIAATSAPINPAEVPVTKFTSNVKKFPAPDSELSARITFYQGRTDRVIIDETNSITSLKGTPGTYAEPDEPSNALTINMLKIPPYPSIPYVLSADTIAFADTKIANEKYSTKRLNEYRIDAPLDAGDRTRLQPRGYTMQDIGQLERRISTLEYYTSLSLTETLAQKRSIPGFDGLERFKFGFFVDGFEDYKYADLSNPGYSAAIIDGYLSPKVSEYNINLEQVGGDTSTILPYNEVNFISQTRATDGPLVADTAQTATQVIVSVNQAQRSFATSDAGNVYEEFFYTMSSKTGPVEFYINSRDNNIGAAIYQSSSPDGPWTQPLLTSGTGAAAITTADINQKQLRLNSNRKIEHPGSLRWKSYGPVEIAGPSGRFLEDQFKLLWTHNPDNGLYYKIRIYKGRRHGGFLQSGKAGSYEYKLFYPTDTEVNLYKKLPTKNFDLSYIGQIYGGDLTFNGTNFNLL
jgi:hypothetical protein